jgi:hypothetical protein
MKHYMIYGKRESFIEGENMYWSNDIGWTLKEGADVFSQSERDTLNLPIGGEWEELDLSLEGNYRVTLEDVLEWMTTGEVDGVHYCEQSIIDRIKEVLN